EIQISETRSLFLLTENKARMGLTGSNFIFQKILSCQMQDFRLLEQLEMQLYENGDFSSPNDRRGLISFCLCFIMKNANSPEGYVLVKVASVAAQLLKRGWLDFTAAEKEAFFHEVEQAVQGSHGLDVQFAGINFLESLVSEFSPSTSSAMGLPREFHEQCRISLEQEYMKAFYCWVQYAAFNVSDRIIGANSEIPEVKVCSAALRLMLQILNWDFRGKNSIENSKRGMDIFYDGMKQDSLRRSECILVQPGPAWRDVLISSGHVGWLLNFYSALRQKFSCEGYWLDCPLAVSARKLIVQFCSLTGTIFPSDSGNMQRQHLLQMLAGIVQWIEPPDAVSKAIKSGKSESELLDGCRALMSVATVTTPLVFDELLKSFRPYGTITLLSALMCEVIKDLMENRTEEETWSWVARDILLDTWTTLLMQLDASGHKHSLPPEGISAAANLFALIVESELRAASASAFNDEDEYDYLQASIAAMDERLSSYALIARAAVGATIPHLKELLSERIMRLHQIWKCKKSRSLSPILKTEKVPKGRGTGDPTETLEELYSLLLITGHVLADEGQGETPLVPKEIESHYTTLLSSIIRFAEESLDPELRRYFFSPRLMEAPETKEKALNENDLLDVRYLRCESVVCNVSILLNVIGNGFAGLLSVNSQNKPRGFHHVGKNSVAWLLSYWVFKAFCGSKAIASKAYDRAVVWFLARWSSTYLMPPGESGENKGGYENYNNTQHLPRQTTNALVSFFGENDQGKAVLDVMIRISLSTLVSYPGERTCRRSHVASCFMDLLNEGILFAPCYLAILRSASDEESSLAQRMTWAHLVKGMPQVPRVITEEYVSRHESSFMLFLGIHVHKRDIVVMFKYLSDSSPLSPCYSKDGFSLVATSDPLPLPVPFFSKTLVGRTLSSSTSTCYACYPTYLEFSPLDDSLANCDCTSKRPDRQLGMVILLVYVGDFLVFGSNVGGIEIEAYLESTLSQGSNGRDISWDSWRDLATAFTNERVLFSLNAGHQRSLAQTLAVSASGMKTSEASNQYIKSLTSHMTSSLVELSSKNDLKAIAQQPDIILLVSCLLERLRGVARASEPRTQKAIYEMGFLVMNPVLIFLQAYKDESVVVYLLLKFVTDWVDGQIIYLEAQETAAVVDFSMRLLQLYSSNNLGRFLLAFQIVYALKRMPRNIRIYGASTTSLKSMFEGSVVPGFALMLEIGMFSQVDFASEPIETYGTNISQVVYTGLHIVTPLITMDLLKYPKLCHSYFSLLSHMLEVYPEIIAQLNVEACNHILRTLDFGLHHQDVEVVDLCLRALRALASHHYKDRGDGKVGLGSHATSYKDPDGKFHEGILGRFLRSLLQLLLFEDYSTDLVSSGADALLPLILCEQSVYQNLANELIERQVNQTFRSRLTNAFQSLITSNNLSSTLDRMNYQRFRKNLLSFLVEDHSVSMTELLLSEPFASGRMSVPECRSFSFFGNGFFVFLDIVSSD
ncbi:UNVERIFIED_CONTAM: Exportin-4, partial [Sesamum calycinum]